jgi:cell division protein FtsA
MNEGNMDTVIDLGSSKVKISTFDQKKKIISYFSEKIDDRENIEEISSIIKKLIKYSEKEISNHIEDINLIFDHQNFSTIDISIKKNIDHIKSPSELMFDAKQECAQIINSCYKDQRIIQSFISSIKLDKIELKKIPKDLKDYSDIIFEFKLLCISVENFSYLKSIFSKNNLEIKNTFCSSVVRSFNYMNNFKNEKSIAFLDIGFLRSSLVLFKNSNLQLIKNIPIGGQSITKDISYMMKIDLKDSEEIKHLFNKSETDFSYSGEINQEENSLTKKLITKKISIDLLKKVILARVEEILNLLFVDTQISGSIEKEEILLVLIGGGSKLFDKNSFNFENSNNFKDIIFYEETDKEICKSGLEYALKYNQEKENSIKNNKNKGIFEKFFNLFQKI